MVDLFATDPVTGLSPMDQGDIGALEILTDGAAQVTILRRTLAGLQALPAASATQIAAVANLLRQAEQGPLTGKAFGAFLRLLPLIPEEVAQGTGDDLF